MVGHEYLRALLSLFCFCPSNAMEMQPSPTGNEPFFTFNLETLSEISGDWSLRSTRFTPTTVMDLNRPLGLYFVVTFRMQVPPVSA